MTKNRWAALARLLALMCLVGAGFQSNADVFQKALSLERSGGDLKGAIALYKQIVDKNDDEALAAQAQLRIGFCYEKLGWQDAQKAFQVVIDRFPKQIDAVKAARDRLAMMGREYPPPAKSGELSLRQVDLPFGEPSPDGKWIAFGDDDGGLSLMEIATGKKSVLVKIGEGDPNCVLADFPGGWWSPSGSQIAYALWSTTNSKSDLYIVDKTSSTHRLIFRQPKKDVQGIAGWTPDEKEIVVSVRNEDKTCSLIRISLAGGPIRDIITSERMDSDAPRLSPDGRFVAYTYSLMNIRGEGDIRIVSLDGTGDRFLIQHPADDFLLGWTPDNTHILFTSDRNGSDGIWIQTLKDGVPEGEPKFLRTIAGFLDFMGTTKDGVAYFGESQGGQDVYQVQLDFESGKVLYKPEKLEKKYNGLTALPFWSDDGQCLGYFFNSELKPRPLAIGNYNILRLIYRGASQARELRLDFKPSTGWAPSPRWSADGKSILMTGSKDKTDYLFRVNPETGASDIISQAKNVLTWTKDGRYLYSIGGVHPPKMSEWQSWIIQKDLVTGREKELYRTKIGEMCSWMVLSQDDQWLAFKPHTTISESPRARFVVIPSQGGEPKEIYKTDENTGASFFWGPPGKGLFFGIGSEKGKAYSGQKSQIWRFPTPDSIHPMRTEFEIYGMLGLAASPDGKNAAYTSMEPIVSKKWAMENYIPKK